MNYFLPGAFFIASILTGCVSKSSKEEDMNQIQKLIREEKQAHLSKDASLLVSHFSDTYKEINAGRIIRLIKEEFRKGFQQYFDGVNFEAWDDNELPVITISDDGTMAYVIVNKHVKYISKKTNEVTDYQFVWLSVYRKMGNVWKLDCVISTNK